jgi:hypothetical protein
LSELVHLSLLWWPITGHVLLIFFILPP